MKFVFDIDGTLCFDGRLIDQTIIDTLLQLQHASNGYIIGPSEAYTHAILKLDKVKHIDNNALAICKVLKSYK